MGVKCRGTRTNGTPCAAYAIVGGTVCSAHGGRSPQVARKAAIRAEVQRWSLGSADIDPAETLLRLLSTAVARACMYSAELERMVAEHGLHATVVGTAVVVDDHGGTRLVREYVRGLIEAESRERKMAADVASKALAAGVSERLVRVAESTAESIATVLRAVSMDPALGMTDVQRAALPGVIRSALALVPGVE